MIKIPYLTALTTYFSYGLLFVIGHSRDFFRKIFDWCHASNLQGTASINLGPDDFYHRRLFSRIQDCFARPIASAPDAWFDVVERFSDDSNKTLKRTDKVQRCLNLGSYNYLGFAAADEYCTPRVIETLKHFSPRTTSVHKELEECVAKFVRKPDAVVFAMGYVTNSAIIPGAQKLARIRENSNFFRSELQRKGFEVLGEIDSPIMPIMLYNPAKIPLLVAVVVVGFPATPLLLSRARFCISASHTREDLVHALEIISKVGDLVGIKYLPTKPKEEDKDDRMMLE